MIVIKSKLNAQELDKKIKEQSENRLSLNLTWLATHNLDGSRKYNKTDIQKNLNSTQDTKIKIEALDKLLYNSEYKLDEAFVGKISQVIEIPSFKLERQALGISDADIEIAKNEIINNPNIGDVIKGSHGARKLRIAICANNKGKSSGARSAYLNYYPDETAYFIGIIIKSEQENFTKNEIKLLASIVDSIKL